MLDSEYDVRFDEKHALEIVLGEDIAAQLNLFSLKTYKPYDLTAVTTVRAKLANDAGTTLTVVCTVDSATLGLFTVPITAAESLLLAVGESQGIEIELDTGGLLDTLQLSGRVKVRARIV